MLLSLELEVPWALHDLRHWDSANHAVDHHIGLSTGADHAMPQDELRHIHRWSMSTTVVAPNILLG